MKVRHTLQLRQKILLLFAMTWVVAIIVIGIVTLYGRIKENRHAEIEKNAVTLNACKTVTQNNIESINLVAVGFAMDGYVSQLMSSDFVKLGPIVQNRIINRIDKLIYANSYRAIFKTGLSLGMFCSDGRIYANPNYHIRRVDNDPDDDSIIGYPQIESNLSYEIKNNDIFNLDDSSVRTVYIRQFNLIDNKSEKGTIALIIPNQMLTEGFDNVIDREWAVLEKNNCIIESSDEKKIGQSAVDAYGYYLSFPQYSNVNGSINHNGDIVSYAHDERSNLTYIMVTPASVVFGSLKGYLSTFVFICLGIIIVLLVFSWYLSKRLTNPLDKLQRIMEQAEEGNLNVRANLRTDDEIGAIGSSFDKMITKLSDSIDNIQRVEQENRRAEMKIMELQLKPHFLYNTLSSIIWLANEDKTTEVMDITKSLALFYRVTLSDGREEISAGDELGNVRNYANIQHYRYQDKFKVLYDIDHNIDDCMVPKLILQPLVENSINYGMKPKINNNGLIIVKGYIDDGEVIFEVIDNGDEITEEKIADLNRKLEEKTSGIGTGNVYGRVHHYGEQYRLVYERQGSNTVARINLPIKKEEADESFNS